jgi:4-hydroxy-4-methyl-2-oxoglutarate aldolase
LGRSVRIGEVIVCTGDLVVADADGVAVLPFADAARIVAEGIEREEKEKDIVARIKRGERSCDIYGLPENPQ